jgi:hypothetical protein
MPILDIISSRMGVSAVASDSAGKLIIVAALLNAPYNDALHIIKIALYSSAYGYQMRLSSGWHKCYSLVNDDVPFTRE